MVSAIVGRAACEGPGFIVWAGTNVVVARRLGEGTCVAGQNTRQEYILVYDQDDGAGDYQ